MPGIVFNGIFTDFQPFEKIRISKIDFQIFILCLILEFLSFLELFFWVNFFGIFGFYFFIDLEFFLFFAIFLQSRQHFRKISDGCENGKICENSFLAFRYENSDKI